MHRNISLLRSKQIQVSRNDALYYIYVYIQESKAYLIAFDNFFYSFRAAFCKRFCKPISPALANTPSNRLTERKESSLPGIG